MRRLDALREKLNEKSLDAIIISVPENRRYLSGFTGSAGYLVVSRTDAVLATDFRYTEQAGSQSPDYQIVRMGADWSWLLDSLKEQGFEKVGFEGHQVPVATYQQMTKALEDIPSSDRPSLVSTQGIVEGIRSVKESEEVSLLQKAIDVADGAMQAIAPHIQPGQTERDDSMEPGEGHA